MARSYEKEKYALEYTLNNIDVFLIRIMDADRKYEPGLREALGFGIDTFEDITEFYTNSELTNLGNEKIDYAFSYTGNDDNVECTAYLIHDGRLVMDADMVIKNMRARDQFATERLNSKKEN